VPDLIHLLPDSVANQIAAGEVIQRPSSVVKELVENSLDAGADRITVHIKDAGRTLVQVSDNGKGMSPTDARMAFERHATSKIRDAADLFAIRTMGFRGEALASIASVSEVEMKTKRPEDEVGTFLHVAASEVITQEVCSCPEGTTFWVKNLFYNVPARRKFLKSNATEVKHLITEIQRVALISTDVFFSLVHNGTIVFELPPSNFRKRIVAIFGHTMNQSLVPVRSETSLASIDGFVGQPKFARKTFGEQFFFVNGRFMKHPFFHRAVVQAYERILPGDMMPAYFICFEVDPATIDINIHPTKTEIKFENESAIWQLLHAAVREALGKFNVVPSIDFDPAGRIDIPVPPRSSEGLRPPVIETDPMFNPFGEQFVSIPSRGFSSGETGGTSSLPGDDPFQSEAGISWHRESGQNAMTQIPFSQSDGNNALENRPNFIILKNRYILTPVKSGLMVVDRQRAQQRILYEQFFGMLEEHEGACQQLLFPQTLEVHHADAALLSEMLDDLNAMGFDIRVFGPSAFIVSGIPAVLEHTDPKRIIEGFLEAWKSSAASMKDAVRERIALSMARASTFDSGEKMTPREAGHLIDRLFACTSPNFSPTGKPVVEIILVEEIEKRLKI